MGLLDYYRRFEGLSEEEVNAGLRAEAEERRRKALSRVDPLDLSATTWHEPPHPDVVNAITFAARRALQRHADPHAEELRLLLAQRAAIEPQRVVVGNGAAGLLAAMVHALVAPGGELLMPWPSYGLLPVLARDAGARAVPVAGFDADALLGAVTASTRLVVVCNPNDPTGALMPAAELDRLASALPEQVTLVIDEALREWVSTEEPDATLALLDDHPRLVLVRTFSKAHALAGLRCGYALGGADTPPLLARCAPALGPSLLAQAGAIEALVVAERSLPRRRALVAEERAALGGVLRAHGLDVAPSEANFLWAADPAAASGELRERLGRGHVGVFDGTDLGAPGHVRIAVRDEAARIRINRALELPL